MREHEEDLFGVWAWDDGPDYALEPPRPDEPQESERAVIDQRGSRWSFSKNRLLGAGAVLAVAAFGTGWGVALTEESGGKKGSKSSATKLANVKATPECPTPSLATFRKVENLFTEPVAKARADYLQSPLKNHYRHSVEAATEMIADRTGLENSQEVILDEANRLLSLYGVTAEVAQPGTKVRDLRAPTPEELSSDTFEQNIRGIVTAFANVPEAYIAATGLRTVRLMAGSQKLESVAKPGVIDWNILARNPDVDSRPVEFGISLGYLMMNRICGVKGVDNDPAFENFNGTLIYKNEGMLPYTHMPSLVDYRAGLAPAAKVGIIDSRSLVAVSNDKASLLSVFTGPEKVQTIMSPDHPTLRSKLTYALAQVYDKHPALVKWLAVNSSQYPWTKQNLKNPQPAGLRPDKLPGQLAG